MSKLGDTYKPLKPLLFCLSAENAHYLTLNSLSLLEKIKILQTLCPPHLLKPKKCMNLIFPNAIGLAAGLDKEGKYIDSLGRFGFGFIEVGTFTPLPQKGNSKPRLYRIKEEEALLNWMGFNNPGMEKGFDFFQKSQTFKGVKGVSIGKNKDTPNEIAKEDYLKGMRKFYPQADYLAINFSSPNTPKLREFEKPENSLSLLKSLKEEQKKLSDEFQRYVPLVFKVSPDLEKETISLLSEIFLKEKLDGLIATNTTNHYPPDLKFSHPRGGLSGKPLEEKSLKVIQQFSAHLGTEIPIIASGGIHSVKSALTRIDAGATLIQLYTGLIYEGPNLIENIFKSLALKK